MVQPTNLLSSVLLVLCVVNDITSEKSIQLGAGHQGVNVQQPLNKASWYQHKLGSSNFTCKNVLLMLNRKSHLLSTVSHRITELQKKPTVSPDLKLQMEILTIFQRELKATEKSLVSVLQDLNQTLNSGYQSLEKIKRSCQLRLDDTRDAAVLVEEDYSSILELEKEMKSIHPNTSLQTRYHLLDEIFSELVHAADDLENALQEDVFSDSKRLQGASVETVIKIHENELYHACIAHFRES